MRGLIFGYGNPLRGDDALGPAVAERLAAGDAYEVRVEHQLTIDLAEDVAQAAWVIFIDAREGGAPGTIAVEPVPEDGQPPSSFTHYVSPGQLLAAARSLYGRAPRAWLVTAAAESFAFQMEMSGAMSRAIEEVVGEVERLARQLSAEPA